MIVARPAGYPDVAFLVAFDVLDAGRPLIETVDRRHGIGSAEPADIVAAAIDPDDIRQARFGRRGIDHVLGNVQDEDVAGDG